jgi:hypothetical protein
MPENLTKTLEVGSHTKTTLNLILTIMTDQEVFAAILKGFSLAFPENDAPLLTVEIDGKIIAQETNVNEPATNDDGTDAPRDRGPGTVS